MTGIYRNERHDYWAEYDGTKIGPLPSVTGILDVLDKPQLVAWKVKRTAAFAVDHIGTIGEMLQAAPGSEAETAAWIAREADRQRDAAGVKGTDVHAICAEIALGQPRTALDARSPLKPYVDGFQAWIDRVGPEIVAVERMGVNYEIGYGGTFDLVARFNGHTWMIDLKSSKGVYPLTAGQLAAYAKFDHLGEPGNPDKIPMPAVSKFGVLHLTPDGAHFIEYRPTKATWDMFMGAAACLRWLKGEARTVMLGELT